MVNFASQAGAARLGAYRPSWERPANSGNAIGGVLNKYLGKYAATLKTDKERAAFEEAKQLHRSNMETLRQGNSAALLAGGGNWRELDDYLAVRKQTEALLGRKFSATGISGGGDVNERPDVAPRSAADDFAQQTRRVDTSGGRMAGGSESLLVGGASERESLALRLLRAQVEQAEQANSNALYDRMDFNQGGPATLSRQRSLDKLKRESGYEDTLSDAAAKSSAYWRFGEPIDVHRADLADQQAQRGHARAVDLANAKGTAATWDDVIRSNAAMSRDATNFDIAQGRAAASIENNARQYGDEDRMAEMVGENNRRMGIGQPPPRPGSVEGEMATSPQGQRWIWTQGTWRPAGR